MALWTLTCSAHLAAASCDVCAPNTCTDCTDGFILNLAAKCFSGCPATEHGVVDTDRQCLSRSDACFDVCPSNTCIDCSGDSILNFARTECVPACPASEYGVVDTDPQCSSCRAADCDVCPSNMCTDCSSTHILDVAGPCVSACPATEYGVVDTDPQCSSCSGANCDVCASNKCTDCSSTYILDVTETCVSECPAIEYGVVDTDPQCSSCKRRAPRRLCIQHPHRLQQHPHLGRGGAGGQHPITHVMIASRSVFGVDQPPAFDWRLANRTYLPIARMAVGSPGEHGAPRTTETLVASACALAPEEGDPPLIYGCRTQARPASLLPDGAFVCSNPAAVPN